MVKIQSNIFPIKSWSDFCIFCVNWGLTATSENADRTLVSFSGEQEGYYTTRVVDKWDEEKQEYVLQPEIYFWTELTTLLPLNSFLLYYEEGDVVYLDAIDTLINRAVLDVPSLTQAVLDPKQSLKEWTERCRR
ncbi:hypothetical protein ACQ4M3_13000 [Leptolyngbya sp. AN03gr2]|uniref:hypothetical protein n=1 Tax=unclassified Leptolyngbya TaxID=2650499 RepID=UPI003D310E59